MEKEIKCPECGSKEDMTLWRKGHAGYPITLFATGDVCHSDTPEFDEMYDDKYTCSCGYETEIQGNFIVEKNSKTWWGRDATRILDYVERHRGHMSDFEVLEDIMCGSYVDDEGEY